MKKLVSLIIALFFVVVLGACQRPIEDVEQGEQDQITLTYSAWNLGSDLERLMLEAFEDAHPNITIEIIERTRMIDSDTSMEVYAPWDEFLTTQASIGQLPDVFTPSNVTLSMQEEWIYDLSSLATNDPEFANVNTEITDMGRYGNQLLALPLAAHYYGFIVNNDVYNETNYPSPQFGVEWDQFLASVKTVANHTAEGEGIAGFEGVEHIMNWYPAQLNENLGWVSNVDQQLTDQAYQEAIEVRNQLSTSKLFVLESLSAEEQAEFFGQGAMWDQGRQVVKFDGSFAIGELLSEMESGNIEEFDLSFIGTPSVDGTQRIPMSLDYIAVSSQTQHPEAAYELAKWMGFGKEGYEKRLSIASDEGIYPSYAPMQTDQASLDAFFDIYNEVDGFREVIEHGQYIIEPIEYLPENIENRSRN